MHRTIKFDKYTLYLYVIYVLSALYNETSLKYPEFNTDFSRLSANLLMYTHTSLPEHWDEIAEQTKKMYFPSGCMNSHSNALDVSCI